MKNWKEIEKRFDDLCIAGVFGSGIDVKEMKDFLHHEIDSAVEDALLKQHLKEMSI